MAFRRWISKLVLCFKNSNDRFSPFFCTIRCPMSLVNFFAFGPHGPHVSNPSGSKRNRPSSTRYLALFFSSASSAAAPARTVERVRWDAARVSMQVTSQTKLIPRVHGTSVIPSGRRSFSITSPGGSKMASTPPTANARRTTSFKLAWRLRRPAGFALQLNPWCPVMSTAFPQPAQECSRQTVPPRRCATAMRSELSSRRLPTVGVGSAWSHAPDSFSALANTRARSFGFAPTNMSPKKFSTIGVSHSFCTWRTPATGSSHPDSAPHSCIGSSTTSSMSNPGVILATNPCTAWTEAKKAEIASSAVRRIPRPPFRTGRDACLHTVSVIRVFVTIVTASRIMLSNSSSLRRNFHAGAVRRM